MLPAAAAAITSVILGAAFVAARYAMAESEPASLAFLRFAIAIACLLLFLALVRNWRMAPRHALAMLALGSIQFGIFHISYNAGLDRIPAARAAIIFSLVPFLTMMIGAALRYERLTWNKAAGVAITIAGVALALGDRASLGATGPWSWTGLWAGDLMVFFSVCCGSTYNVLSRPYLTRYPTVPATLVGISGGLLVIAPVAATEGLFAAWPSFSAGGWAAVLFLALPASALSFFLWNWALGRATPTLVAIFLPLSPIAAAGFGALVLGEAISLLYAAGLALVIAGIWLAYRRAGT